MEQSQTKIPTLFYLLYFSGLLNSYIEQQYKNETLIKGFQQDYFFLIMGFVQMGCSAVIGFIIDHVQYSLNYLFVSQILEIVSFSFYLANLFTNEQNNLYFAIGFQILGQSSSEILILTLITKHFSIADIPKQIGIYYQFSYYGKLLCFLLTFRGAQSLYLQFYLAPLFFVILCFTTYSIAISFTLFRLDAYKIIKDLKQNIILENSDLLSAIKFQLNNQKILIIITASSMISIVILYQQTLLAFFYIKVNVSSILFIDQKDYTFYFYSISCIFGILFSYLTYSSLLGKKDAQYIALQNIYDASTSSLVCFIVSTAVVANYHSFLILQLFIYIIIMIWQEYNLASLYISSTYLIGQDKNEFRTKGLTFGVFSMFINVFDVIVTTGFVQLGKTNFYSFQMMTNSFGFCQSIFATICSKILQIQYSKVQNVEK